MSTEGKLSIINDPAISAIYFALLQCGYEFYPIERDAPMVDRLRGFVSPENGELSFFSQVRQNTCEVYPYWPRAFMLEAATFYIDLPQAGFVGFGQYKNKILRRSPMSPSVDVSYYLDGGASGVLNAFEEYTVCKLTDKIVNGDAPENLGIFFDQEFDL